MEIFASPVQVVRESIATITQILAERDIPVYQRGMNAHVEYDVDGNPISVCLPYLPDDASEELILSVQGFLDHEVGHLLFTEQAAIIEIAHDRELLEMHNVFEDPFVERKMRARFPGSRHNFSRLYDFFIHKIVDKNLTKLMVDEVDNPLAYFGVLLPCISRAWAGFEQFNDYLADKWELVEPITRKIPEDIIKQVPLAANTRDNIEIARKVLIEIMRVPEDSEEDSIDGGTVAVKGEPGESGGGSPSDGSSPSKSSASAPPTMIDEEGDIKDYDDPETDSSDDVESDDVDPDDVDSDGSGDVDSDDDLDTAPDVVDDEGSEEHGYGDDDEPFDVPDDTVSDEACSASGDESGEDDEAEAKGGLGDEGESSDDPDLWTPEEGDSFSDYAPGDIDKALGEAIGEMAREAASDTDYLVYSTDDDKTEIADYSFLSSEGVDQAVRKLDEHTADVTGMLQSDFERTFVSENRSHWRGSQYSGQINPSQLSRIRCNDLRIFRKKMVHKTQDFDVQLVVDCSGSMHGERMTLAMTAAYAMSQALHRVGINFEVIGFTSHDDAPAMPRDYSLRYARLDHILLPVFKDFNEEFGPECLRRMAAWASTYPHPPLAENVDGESLMMCAKRLSVQPSGGKAMIVLSDGSPCCSSQDYTALRQHLKKVTSEIEAANIKLVGIGIQHKGVQEYYTNYAVINNLSDLPTAVIDKVREIVL